jgi:hypothetical protein
VTQYNDIGDSFGQIVTKFGIAAARIPTLSNSVQSQINYYFFLEQALTGLGAILAQVSL